MLRRSQPPPGLRPLGLLSSFPTPPTHIPSSPAVSTPIHGFSNPPPTGPPLAPLPPLPQGPSPVTPAEQIAFIAMRRTSRTSTSSPKSVSSDRDDSSDSRHSSRSDSSASVLPVSPAVSAVHPVPITDRASEPSRMSSPLPPNDDSVMFEKSAPPSPDERDGASSPDIALLIQRTSSSGLSPASSRPSSGSKPRSSSSVSHSAHPSSTLKRLRSTPTFSTSFYPATRPDAPPFPPINDHDPDLEGQQDADPLVPWQDLWEDQVHSDEEEDALIDLQTSLPHLMLRAGLLSPHSKLLPRPSPSPEPHDKKKLPRDTRHTEKRRQRHKDGRLLRGGIGLTTGLGWSDSEDEDAPSALTHRLSRLALSRKSSITSSLRGPSRSTSRAFSRSTSALSSRSSISTGQHSALSRSASASTLSETSHVSTLPYLEEDAQDIDIPEYPYSFAPATPTEQGHGEEHTTVAIISPPPQVSGPSTWRPPRSPLFDNTDPFARQYAAPAVVPAADDRSPTPTSRTTSTASLPLPATPHDAAAATTLPTAIHRPMRKTSMPVMSESKVARPVSKALPPLPADATARLSAIPKTTSVSSLRSVPASASTREPASSGSIRERAPSTTSLRSVGSAQSFAVSSIRTRTSSTSSSARPLKSAIKPTAMYHRPTGMVAPKPSFQTGIAI